MNLLRAFSWKGFLLFIGFATALAAWTWCGVLFSNKPIAFDRNVSYFLELFQRALLNYFPAYVLVGLADGLALRGLRRRVALGVALVGGIATSVQLRCGVSMNELFWAYDAVRIPYCTAFPTWRTYIDFPGSWITPLCIAAVVMIAVFTRRQDRELVASLHQAQAGEVESRRKRVESDIAAMRSRVDPDRLLETLRAIRARYDTSLDEGERMLESLIDDLRNAARAPVGGE